MQRRLRDWTFSWHLRRATASMQNHSEQLLAGINQGPAVYSPSSCLIFSRAHRLACTWILLSPCLLLADKTPQLEQDPQEHTSFILVARSWYDAYHCLDPFNQSTMTFCEAKMNVWLCKQERLTFFSGRRWKQHFQSIRWHLEERMWLGAWCWRSSGSLRLVNVFTMIYRGCEISQSK